MQVKDDLVDAARLELGSFNSHSKYETAVELLPTYLPTSAKYLPNCLLGTHSGGLIHSECRMAAWLHAVGRNATLTAGTSLRQTRGLFAAQCAGTCNGQVNVLKWGRDGQVFTCSTCSVYFSPTLEHV